MDNDKKTEAEELIKTITREAKPSLKTKEEDLLTLTEYIEEAKKEEEKTKTTFMKKEVVERFLAEVLTQIKLALDVVWYEGLSKKYASIKPVEAVKGLYVIAGKECSAAAELLEPYHSASLNPKHRGCRKIINVYLDRIEEHRIKLLNAKNTNNKAIKEFVRETIDFLSAYHVVLHEDTPKKERSRTLRNYCD